MTENQLLKIENLHKQYPGVVALDGVSLSVNRGEVHGLVGANGAGKSTLMSVLFGLYQQEQGIIKKDGVEVKINNPNDANDLFVQMEKMMLMDDEQRKKMGAAGRTLMLEKFDERIIIEHYFKLLDEIQGAKRISVVKQN